MQGLSVRKSRAWREVLLALCVLALAFLNFGHQSAVLAAGGRVVVTGHAVCGEAGAIPAAGDHFACHSCRPDAAVLPPPPAGIVPVVFAVLPAHPAVRVIVPRPAAAHRQGNPRGPPII